MSCRSIRTKFWRGEADESGGARPQWLDRQRGDERIDAKKLLAHRDRELSSIWLPTKSLNPYYRMLNEQNVK